ncbi:MAG: hypothetical protein COY69_00495 [Candidatus Magasanikbacteria bacterium CG_4_10_14_0_8_um_filter_32_14]|uniref:DUF2339 domain-containing protein n=2 Tax=Candidatus Magasanikiibacteriota TaxID=1752731 RepID=A0A2M7RAH6_9BACT|nr:MAG: hypothetical protein AUJ23_03440 [Candidatus Magasanikbacteria bacterium CG1_02_32_51]PIY93654.1 MAG: hypothetical protein COY69_00495 [Candidatus Magasanikbacteria bacterium CG_4_10_14_0_8_um_filter_32_14]
MPEEKNEFNYLKENITKMGQWVTYFQKKQENLDQRLSVVEERLSIKQATPVETIQNQKTPEQNNIKKVFGFISIMVGVVFSLTFFDSLNYRYNYGYGYNSYDYNQIILGVFLILLGIFLVSYKKRGSTIQKNNIQTSTPSVDYQQIPLIKKENILENKAKKNSLEEDIGMKWFARIGILALVIGVGFFIKYAIDMNWINHLTRIILGVVFGIVLIVFGEIISKKEKYLNWGKTLVGGGIAIVYFVVYAAYYFPVYRVALGINQLMDIALLTVVVIFAIGISLRDNSQIIAIGAFSLGFITSLLSNNFELITVIYNLLLCFGLATIVSYKEWPIIGTVGVVAFYLMYSFWTYSGNANHFYLNILQLVSYFVSFSLQSFFLSKRKEFWNKNVIMILLNSFLFFFFCYWQIDHNYHDYLGLFALCMSIVHFFSFYLYKKTAEVNSTNTQLYLALFYLTLTIPIQLNPEWITIFWSLETLLLTLLAFKTKNKTIKTSSYLVAIFTALKTITYDTTVLHDLDLNHLLNSTRLFSFLFTILCFYIIYKIFEKNQDSLNEQDVIIAKAYSWLTSIFLVIIIFIELVTDHSFLVSIILSIFSITYLLTSGIVKKNIFYQSVAIYLVLFLKVLFFDSWKLHDFDYSNFLFSTRLLSFITAIGVLYVASQYLEKRKSSLLEKRQDSLKPSESYLPDVYSYAGTFLAFVLVILEMQEFWISVGWTFLAMIILLLGIAYRKKYLRLQGMLIFAATILKVFIYDTRGLDTIYRTISYMVLGVILLLVSFVYTKYKEKLKEII